MTKQDSNTPQVKPRMKKGRAALILSIIGAVMCGIAALFVILLWQHLKNPDEVRAFVNQNKVVGALILILLSMVQVIIGIIPSEVIELAAGYAFGTWEGAFLVLIGIVSGSIITILLTRKFGRRLVDAFYPTEKLDALPVFADKAKRNMLTFLLFFIPGTPKDLFTYIIGLTDMSIPLYLLLTTAARFPSIITSTVSTDNLALGNYSIAIIAFAISAVLGIIGSIAYKSLITRHNKKVAEKKKEQAKQQPRVIVPGTEKKRRRNRRMRQKKKSQKNKNK